jgi:hypothetical protein
VGNFIEKWSDSFMWFLQIILGFLIGFYIFNPKFRHTIDRGLLWLLNWVEKLDKKPLKIAIKEPTVVNSTPKASKAVSSPKSGEPIVEATEDELKKWLQNNPQLQIIQK